jgi:hypothetical protein
LIFNVIIPNNNLFSPAITAIKATKDLHDISKVLLILWPAQMIARGRAEEHERRNIIFSREKH